MSRAKVVERNSSGEGNLRGKRSTIIPSIFLRRGRQVEYLRPGAAFRCIHHNKTVETAYVESLAADVRGIPHVRFRVAFSSSSRPLNFGNGTRILALKIFADRYRERVVL